MENVAHVASRKTFRRHRPPERFHLFVSYTTREEEVRIVKPIVDHFLNTVLRQAIESTLGEPPAFYDAYSLYHPEGRGWSRTELETILRFAIEESEVLLAFLSPEYVQSEWCRFECSTMASKQRRPWFDLCRTPPIPELRDGRPPALQPHWLERILAALLMWLWRRHKEPPKPGGAFAIVLWKGEVNVHSEMREFRGVPVFDCRSCVPGGEAWARVFDHLHRHGSVSPSWESEARALRGECEESMGAAATAIVEILQQRRRDYAIPHHD